MSTIIAMVVSAYADDISVEKLSKLPEVDEKINGFTTVERGTVDLTGADTAYFNHDKYYHLSNALIILYGDLDYKSFLKHYDEKFLSKYDKKDMNIETGVISPLNQEQDKTYLFDVENGSSAEKSSIIDYAFALNEITTEEFVALDLI